MKRKITNDDREAVLKLADANLTEHEISLLTKIAKSTVYAIIRANRYAQTLSYEDFNSKLSVHGSPATAAWALERNGVQVPADDDAENDNPAPPDDPETILELLHLIHRDLQQLICQTRDNP